MNGSKPPMSLPLRAMLLLCHEVATSYGIPLEVAVVRLISLGAAMAGDLVQFKSHDGQVRNARLSLLLVTDDATVPLYFTVETEELFRRQAQMVGKPTSPFEDARLIAELRRKLRALSHFEPNPGFGARAIKAMIELNKRRKSLGAFTTMGKAPSSVCKPDRTTIMVESAATLRKILRSVPQENGWWQALVAAEKPMELLACLPDRQWRELARQPNAGSLLGRVWAIPCPASSFDPETSTPPKLLCGHAFKRLEYARLGSVGFHFAPPDEARELLDHSVEQFRAMDLDLRSLNGYDTPLPDPYLAWKFSGILTALCCDGTGEELKESFLQCARLGCAVASWVLRQHAHRLRTSFPRTQGQELTQVDRRVLRALTPEPAPVRTVQRRLKQVSKAACLDSLGYLVGAKLAMEAPPGHFAIPEEPGHSHELSTFLSTFDPKQIFPLRPVPRATDGTDNGAV